MNYAYGFDVAINENILPNPGRVTQEFLSAGSWNEILATEEEWQQFISDCTLLGLVVRCTSKVEHKC